MANLTEGQNQLVRRAEQKYIAVGKEMAEQFVAGEITAVQAAELIMEAAERMQFIRSMVGLERLSLRDLCVLAQKGGSDV